jgi:hypothetical protein
LPQHVAEQHIHVLISGMSCLWYIVHEFQSPRANGFSFDLECAW